MVSHVARMSGLLLLVPELDKHRLVLDPAVSCAYWAAARSRLSATRQKIVSTCQQHVISFRAAWDQLGRKLQAAWEHCHSGNNDAFVPGASRGINKRVGTATCNFSFD